MLTARLPSVVTAAVCLYPRMDKSKLRWWDVQNFPTNDYTLRTSYPLSREASVELDSPSTSTAPTPEPRLPQQTSVTSNGGSWMTTTNNIAPSHNSGGTSTSFQNINGISQLRLNSRPSSSFPPRKSHPALFPASSSTSQSDDDDGDEMDRQDFADKNFLLVSSRPVSRRGPLAKLRTRSAGVIPDEALDWLSQASALSGSGKGKDSTEGFGSSLMRRRTITDDRRSTDGNMDGKEDAVRDVVGGIASTIPQEIILHVRAVQHHHRSKA